MDVHKAIRERRTTREYMDIPVEFDKVTEIVDAGRLAPSAGNLQNWKFIVVFNEAIRQQIAEACLQQYWMAKAPIHIVVCTEPEKAKTFYGIRGERLYSIQNCAIAATHMMLQAQELGLKTAWVGAFDEDMLKRTLNIPGTARPQVVLTVGYSDEKPPMPMKYAIEHCFYFDTWKNQIIDPLYTLGYKSHKVEAFIKKMKELGKKTAEKLSNVGEKPKKK